MDFHQVLNTIRNGLAHISAHLLKVDHGSSANSIISICTHAMNKYVNAVGSQPLLRGLTNKSSNPAMVYTKTGDGIEQKIAFSNRILKQRVGTAKHACMVRRFSSPSCVARVIAHSHSAQRAALERVPVEWNPEKAVGRCGCMNDSAGAGGLVHSSRVGFTFLWTHWVFGSMRKFHSKIHWWTTSF